MSPVQYISLTVAVIFSLAGLVGFGVYAYKMLGGRDAIRLAEFIVGLFLFSCILEITWVYGTEGHL